MVARAGVTTALAGASNLANQKGRVNAKDNLRTGKDFTSKGKKEVIEDNKNTNDGVNKCEICGVETVPAQKSEKGVTPPRNEIQVDHINAKSKGGAGLPSNGQVLCRDCNRKKSDN
ncbi:MAG: HNH endonuclease [Sphingobacteriales bacterium]|nr:MAG: HNH endonuclease [Sphingobacteriales bacterium]